MTRQVADWLVVGGVGRGGRGRGEESEGGGAEASLSGGRGGSAGVWIRLSRGRLSVRCGGIILTETSEGRRERTASLMDNLQLSCI